MEVVVLKLVEAVVQANAMVDVVDAEVDALVLVMVALVAGVGVLLDVEIVAVVVELRVLMDVELVVLDVMDVLEDAGVDVMDVMDVQQDAEVDVQRLVVDVPVIVEQTVKDVEAAVPELVMVVLGV